ncbi:HdeD family acid-resistance protein [Flavobacterium restrictum]|uniref:HdeD family acid-resistance protein n=1 Tax=Flavobacterium restrictum TaxID=2594428 RepID=A0A553ECY3_9FLAO|nr:DUF308 domain-containing protein [Flavobacterium restrictum]TRX42781.1 hypothetical protein FNW21_00145 [Flavobacterium restrictum]
MIQLLFRKWWLILIQGLLLIILSIYIFDNPVVVLAALSFWFGVLVITAGVIGVITWLFATVTEKEGMSLLWSIFSVGFGIVLLLNLVVTMKTITMFFAFWMLITGFKLIQSGWSLRAKNSFGWLMLLAGLFSVVAAVMLFFNLGTGAIGVSTLLGMQVLLTGVALVLLSFAKKAVVGIVKEKIDSLKSEI